jgi:hypothetical protein
VPEVSHLFGDDIDLSAAGDLATVDGLSLSQQAILRRLLTNPLALPFAPTYGAGLGAFVGSTVNTSLIQGLIAQQMLLEQDVDQTTPPNVAVSYSPGGEVAVMIQYVAISSGSSVLGFQLGQNSITVTAS